MSSPAQGFVPWHPVQHPQLGEVEVGGFDLVHFWYNIPFDRLEREVAPHSEWLIYLGLTTPRIALRSASVEALGPELWRVRAVVENRGYLPTNGSQKAIDQQIVAGVRATIVLPAGARLLTGEAAQELGELAGRTGQRSTATWWGYQPGTPDRALAEWIVSGPVGASFSIAAAHPRAGTVRQTLVLAPTVE